MKVVDGGFMMHPRTIAKTKASRHHTRAAGTDIILNWRFVGVSRHFNV